VIGKTIFGQEELQTARAKVRAVFCSMPFKVIAFRRLCLPFRNKSLNYCKIMKTESLYRLITIVLLGGILAVQIAILKRISKPLDVNVQNNVEVHKNPLSL
jgi:hypothetical protein